MISQTEHPLHHLFNELIRSFYKKGSYYAVGCLPQILISAHSSPSPFSQITVSVESASEVTLRENSSQPLLSKQSFITSWTTADISHVISHLWSLLLSFTCNLGGLPIPHL